MNVQLSIVAPLLLAVGCSNALAFQPLVTDDTGTQGKAGNQIEISINQDRREQAGSTATTVLLPGVYTRGLGDSLDIYVTANHTRIRAPGADASGSGNPAAGLKWRFYEEESSKTSLGLKPEIRFPVGAAEEAAGLGSGRSSVGVTLILSQEVAFGAVHANLAAGRNRFRNTTVNPDASTFRASIAPVWDVSEEWKLALDLGSETETAAGAKKRSTFAEIGAVFSPSKDLDWAFGLIHRTDNASPRATTTSVTLGLTWRFK